MYTFKFNVSRINHKYPYHWDDNKLNLYDDSEKQSKIKIN